MIRGAMSTKPVLLRKSLGWASVFTSAMRHVTCSQSPACLSAPVKSWSSRLVEYGIFGEK